ncbi:MAG: YqhA family protein [Anaerolineae bacterium]
MIAKTLAGARYVFLIAVISTLILALGLFIYGAVAAGSVLWQALDFRDFARKEAKDVVVAAIEVIDLFLIATVAYITGLGLYELFVDDKLELPGWLQIHSLDDLKSRLIGVLVVVIAISYLGFIATWKGGDWAPLAFGGGAALIIAALTFFIWKSHD